MVQYSVLIYQNDVIWEFDPIDCKMPSYAIIKVHVFKVIGRCKIDERKYSYLYYYYSTWIASATEDDLSLVIAGTGNLQHQRPFEETDLLEQ